jgi:Tol biopolymer transport system component
MPHRTWIVASLLALSAARATADNSPSLFGPGIISGAADDLAPTFTPDGKTVYFTRGNPSASMIVMSESAGGTWSQPVIAPFSGAWSDLEPAMAPDGSFMVFASNRPSAAGGPALEGHYQGKTIVGGGGNLWRVDRKGTGWSEPYRLPDTINADTCTFSPSVVADGSIYFMRCDQKTGRFHLFRSQLSGGGYQPAVATGLGDAGTEEVDPAVAPD